MVDRGEATKKLLEARGVLAIRSFLDPIEVDVLQACVMMAKMLLNVDESGITETVISGGTRAMNIPVAKFTEENCQFKPARNVCKNISDRLKVIPENEYDPNYFLLAQQFRRELVPAPLEERDFIDLVHFRRSNRLA